MESIYGKFCSCTVLQQQYPNISVTRQSCRLTASYPTNITEQGIRQKHEFSLDYIDSHFKFTKRYEKCQNQLAFQCQCWRPALPSMLSCWSSQYSAKPVTSSQTCSSARIQLIHENVWNTYKDILCSWSRVYLLELIFILYILSIYFLYFIYKANNHLPLRAKEAINEFSKESKQFRES